METVKNPTQHAALFIDVQSFAGMSRPDALAYSNALARQLTEFRTSNVPVIWVTIAPGGSKLLPPSTEPHAQKVRDLSILETMGYDGHHPTAGNHDIYAEFMKNHGPRENEALYRKPSMSALATVHDIKNRTRILEEAGVKLESARANTDHPATKYIHPTQQQKEFVALFPEGPTLHDHLTAKGITDTHIFGAVSKYCVAETAISAATKGYTPHIRSDLVLSWTYPVNAMTRANGQLVWAGFDHNALIETAISDALGDPIRNFTAAEKNKIAAINIMGQSPRTPITENHQSKTLHEPKPVAPRLKPSFQNGVAAAAMALTTGVMTYMQAGSTSQDVTNNMIETAIPGWSAARRGESCKAFAQSAGATTAGIAAVLVAPPAAGAAITVTAASGPLAPLVGPLAAAGATAAVAGTAIATNEAVTPIAESACTQTLQLYDIAKHKLGF